LISIHDVDSSNYDQLDKMTEFEVAQWVCGSALRRIRERASLNPGVPFSDTYLDQEDWAELMLLDVRQSQAEVDASDPLALLRESGTPLVETNEPAPLDAQGSRDLLEAFREAKVPLRGPVPQPRELTLYDALVDGGIPMTEATGVVGVPALQRPEDVEGADVPTHRIAAALDEAVHPDHADRPLVDAAVACGAAHTAGGDVLEAVETFLMGGGE
jgi:hypothetical protein